MKKVTIIREKSTDAGTFGILKTEDGFTCHTLELPWKQNKVKLSCIPAGEYMCEIVNSPRFGKVYGVRNVKGRSHILIHSGNYAGDKEKGLKTHVEGCILVGKSKGLLSGERAILSSKAALKELEDHLNRERFTLVIVDTKNL